MLVLGFAICTATIIDLSGKWSGELVTPDFHFTMIYNFKVDGEKLTGTVVGPTGTVSIDSGAIKNDVF